MIENVYAVVFGNSQPTAEVLALYDNEEAAKAHADWESTGSDYWHVVPWSVATEFTPPAGEDG